MKKQGIKKEANMYNAKIVYQFKEGKLEEGIKIWEDGVYNKIASADGFIRVQLYTWDNSMMAIGSWDNKAKADEFMKTGVFKDVMGSFGELLEERPVNKSVELQFFEEK